MILCPVNTADVAKCDHVSACQKWPSETCAVNEVDAGSSWAGNKEYLSLQTHKIGENKLTIQIPMEFVTP